MGATRLLAATKMRTVVSSKITLRYTTPLYALEEASENLFSAL